MKKRMRTTAAVVCSMLFFAACASSPAPAPTGVGPLAVINGEVLTVEELRDGFVKRHGGHTKFLGGESELRKFIEIIVDQRLLVQEAYNLGLDELADIRKATDEYAEKKAFEHLLRTEIDEKAKPTAEEVREAWATKTNEVWHLSEIVIESQREAEEVYAALSSGTDFEQLARWCSIAPSRMRGGRLGMVGWGTLDPAYEDAIARMQPGEISSPFATSTGWAVIQLVDRMDYPQPAFENVRLKIEGILLRRKLESRRKEFSEALWARYHGVAEPIDLDVAKIRAIRESKPDTPVASWDGGALPIKDFLTDPELRMMSMLTPARARQFWDEQLRKAVNDPLAKLEIAERKVTEVPAVAEVVRRYREDLMERVLYADHVLKDVAVSDEEVRAYYDEHRAELTEPEKRRVAHFVVATEEEAKTARDLVEAGADFADVVKKVSTDTPSAKEGGDLGWITKKDTPDVFAPILTMEVGAMSMPIESKFGWHVVKVVDIRPERPMTFEEAQEHVRKAVLEEKKRAARMVWVRKLRDAATVQISDAAIRQYVAQNPFAPDGEAPASPGH